MQAMLVDTHCHFEDERYTSDREEIIEANLKELAFVVNVTADPNELETVVGLAQKHEKIYAALGVHPHFALDITPEEVMQKIEALLPFDSAQADSNKIVGIGECGLDYYFKNQDLRGRTEYEAREAQAELFKTQIDIALQNGLPLIIHTRDQQEGFDAYQDVLKIFEEKNVRRATIHSFSGNLNFARAFVGRGCYLGLSGILTFDPKRSSASPASRQTGNPLVEVVREIPLEHLLLETDAPYLTPVPHRGQRNEPRFTKYIAEKIAEIKNISLDEVLQATEQNARKLFSIGLQ